MNYESPLNRCTQIAKHLRDVHFGGNWTAVNLKDTLTDVSWEQATKKLFGMNAIAALVFHIHYYIRAVREVVEGGPLTAKDAQSFDFPPLQSAEDWETLLEKTWSDAESFAALIERFPENKLPDTFVDRKYGSYYRNFVGIIEHIHYHLGQIVLIKKLLVSSENS